MVLAGSLTSSPSVAIRAYPAKAKNIRPAAGRTPQPAADVRPATRRQDAGPTRAAAATKTRVASTRHSRIRVSNAVRVMPSRLTPSARPRRRRRQAIGVVRGDIVAEGQCHGCAGRRLAGDKAPARRGSPAIRRAASGHRRRYRRWPDTWPPAPPTPLRCSRPRRRRCRTARTRKFPARAAAGAKTTKTPAPSMEPSPMDVASNTPSLPLELPVAGHGGRRTFPAGKLRRDCSRNDPMHLYLCFPAVSFRKACCAAHT